MNIYNRSQIKSWDAFTIHHEPITSIDLMERASKASLGWLLHNFSPKTAFCCICGNGNNGGDGLAIGRLLYSAGYEVSIFLADWGPLSVDCRENLLRAEGMGIIVQRFRGADDFAEIHRNVVILDALFGTGLSRPLEGNPAGIVNWLNTLSNKIVSIDMPSGLPADGIAADANIVEADITLSFQCPKFAFFLPEHERFTGNWIILDIELHRGFAEMERTPYATIDLEMTATILPEMVSRHVHKGYFGHAALFAGSATMMGAALMAVSAGLRSGAGLCTAAIPESGVTALQTIAPEAMYAPQSVWMQHSFYTGKTAVGAGMGWQPDDFYARLLQWLISNVTVPLVLDATALTLLASNLEWLLLRPQGSVTILTPHIGEFNRLAGKSANSAERLEKAKELASQYHVFIILKGAYTQVITPGGLVYFNTSGNPGMAKGGSGDVLSGLLTGLLAKGIAPPMACLLGVFLHGLAGDIAAAKLSQQAMKAMDIVRFLPAAWKKVYRKIPK